MLIPMAVALWFLCGLLAIHLAFIAARRQSETFDPVHIWLAVLGPVSLVLACFMIADGNNGDCAAKSPAARLIRGKGTA